MTDHEHDRERRAELGPFVRDATDALDARGAGVRPDFAAMLARARRLAAEAELRPPAPVIPLVGGQARADAGDADAGLVPFTAALRGALDEQVHARSLAGIPPAPTPRRRFAVVALAAAAAALVLLMGGAQLARRSDGPGDAASAAAARRDDPPTHTAPGVPPPGRGVAVPTPPESPVPRDSLDTAAPRASDPAAQAPVPGDSRDAAGALPSPDRAVPSPARGPRKRRPGADVPPRPSLEEEAQALWQRGELAAAEQKLRAVLAVADRRRVELAYGDLFALVRQMHGPDAQAKLWRAYLGRFPRGRFADDARAGLCQREVGAARATCWREYLAQHPEGAHRAQAEATP